MVRSARVRHGHVRLVALVAALAMTASGCFYEIATDHERTSPDTRPWFCNATGNGTPAGGHGNGSHVHPTYEGMVKGPLSWDECKQLAGQLDTALRSVQKWPTKGQAEADGWRQLAPYVPGLGTHHVRGAGLAGASFDPGQPQFLIYGGPDASAPLVGVAYSSFAANGAPPPEGFVGHNDWYHLHQKICLRFRTGGYDILAGAEEIPDADCTALGGTQTPIPGGGLLLLHAWIIPLYEYRPDIFASGHPCLAAAGVLPLTDPCWDTARRDPALGPPPGSDPPDHGTHGH